jgi:hypothetical protein
MSLKPRRRRLLLTLLVSNASVAVVSFYFAYRAHSFADATAAVVIWLVLAPVFSTWWVRNMESDEGKGGGG